jgi:hypothetical protein
MVRRDLNRLADELLQSVFIVQAIPKYVSAFNLQCIFVVCCASALFRSEGLRGQLDRGCLDPRQERTRELHQDRVLLQFDANNILLFALYDYVVVIKNEKGLYGDAEYTIIYHDPLKVLYYRLQLVLVSCMH